MPKLSQEKKVVLETMTRDALYMAAKEILCEGGWKGLTMDKLAKRAGVAKGTVYNYFRNKQDIVLFVIERDDEPLRRKIRLLAEEARPVEDILGEVLELICLGLIENKRMNTAMVRAFYEGEFDWESPCEDPMAETRAITRRLLQRGMDQGVFRPRDPVLLEILINSIWMGLIESIALGELNDLSESFVSSVKDMILNGLLVRKEEKRE